MAGKMDLITFAATGHVLAAAVRQDTSGAQPDAAALVGDGLLLRDPASGDIRVTLPPVYLAVQSADLREDVLLTARRFQMMDNLPEVAPATLGAAPVTLTANKVTVTLPANAQSDLAAWVYIDGGAQPVVQQVQIPSGSPSNFETLSLPAGSYHALVLVPGYEPALLDVVATP